MNKDFAVTFTSSDDGFMGLQSISFIDLKKPFEQTRSIINSYPLGKLHMPQSPKDGNTTYQDEQLKLEFVVKSDYRKLTCTYINFYQNKPLICDITLFSPKLAKDTSIPANKEKMIDFYYNQKLNCMPASGVVTFNGETYLFNPDTDLGSLDWGRGVCPNDNIWYWSSGNGYVNNKPFGFNIRYDFETINNTTENVIFYDGQTYLMEDLQIHTPMDGDKNDWTITSGNSRFEFKFSPTIDRHIKNPTIIADTELHQFFGTISGTAVLNNGKELAFENLSCFVESIENIF
jgi:hypothetical protein